MEKCDCCGNSYDKSIAVKHQGKSYTFDCFECAIQTLAPNCANCGCRIIGHGVESSDKIYCCAHCVKEKQKTSIKDRE